MSDLLQELKEPTWLAQEFTLSQLPLPAVMVGTVPLERPGRYGKQLVSHFAHKVTATWRAEQQDGLIIFVGKGPESADPRTAFAGSCHVYVKAGADAELLQFVLYGPAELGERFIGVIERHLERFARKEQLTFSWQTRS